MGKKWPLFLLWGTLSSCAFFESETTKTNKLVDTELRGINWNEVDQYPLFEECDETAPKAIQRDCFITYVSKYFTDALQTMQYTATEEVNDTLFVDFRIDENGLISRTTISKSDILTKAVPQVYDDIRDKLDRVIRIAPANKRGVPVKIQVRLPIVLNSTTP